jgi:hypothetical protein
LATLTFVPDTVNTPSQSLVICWPPGQVQLAVQLLVAAVPVLLITTWPWNPPDQELVTE